MNTTLRNEYVNYKKELVKMNVWDEIECLDEFYTITLTQETYEKQGRKCFPRKATETEVSEITTRNYLNYLTSIGFFGDRVEKSYTYIGLVPTKLTCTSPDKEVKIIRRFKIERKDI